MTWTEHHRTSEHHASKAQTCARLDKHDDARVQYALAAVSEEKALLALDRSKSRTYGITAVSAASLYFKAGELDNARRIVTRNLALDWLPTFARRQLRDIASECDHDARPDLSRGRTDSGNL